MTDISYQNRKCPMCGKEFVTRNALEWAYRRNNKVFCSWHCLREYDKGSKPRKADQRDKIIQAINDGLTTREICDLVGVEADKVWYWRDKLKREEPHDTDS